MAANDYFAHQSPITGRWPNAVARANGYELPDWWPDAANNIESLHKGSPDPARVLQSFIESPNHRNHVMGQGWFGNHREIGVGLAAGDRIWSIHTADRESASLFLTGVTYRDSDGDQRMDLGEGLAGATITVDGRATTTTPGGGWAMAVAAGVHEVQASGGGFVGSTTVTVRVGAFNVEVDFVMGIGRSAAPRALVRAYALCQGRPPTILGTFEDDEITGTPGPDVIHGLGGNDVIHGLGGNDIICGGLGGDQLYGDAGDDQLQGGGGPDTLSGGDGNDVLRGQGARDTVTPGPGDDLVVLR
jgi:Ca2+-binding RTX toxin-like protein